MTGSSLQVTYEDGKFVAASLYLAEPKGERRPKTKQLSDSVLLDIDEQGNAIGVEFLSRKAFDAETLNTLLKPYDVRAIEPRELSTAA